MGQGRSGAAAAGGRRVLCRARHRHTHDRDAGSPWRCAVLRHAALCAPHECVATYLRGSCATCFRALRPKPCQTTSRRLPGPHKPSFLPPAYSAVPGCRLCQVHYLPLRPEGDASGVRMTLTDQPTPLSAGMLAFAASFSIPPGRPSNPVPNECCYSGFEPLTGFGVRVHTHRMGRWVRRGADGGLWRGWGFSRHCCAAARVPAHCCPLLPRVARGRQESGVPRAGSVLPPAPTC